MLVLSALVLTFAMLVAACKGDASQDEGRALEVSPPPEVSPSPSPTPDPVDDDPFAIPDEIDEEYLTLVMQELERIRVEGLRGIYADEELTDENTRFLESIYAPDEVERAMRQLRDGGVTAADLRAENLTPSPGVRTMSITRILDSRLPHCIFVEVLTDDTPLLAEGLEAARGSYYYRTLVPRELAADPEAPLNSTPWAIGWAGMDPDRERVDDAEEHSQCDD
jgi:hypothetical protein